MHKHQLLRKSLTSNAGFGSTFAAKHAVLLLEMHREGSQKTKRKRVSPHKYNMLPLSTWDRVSTLLVGVTRQR